MPDILGNRSLADIYFLQPPKGNEAYWRKKLANQGEISKPKKGLRDLVSDGTIKALKNVGVSDKNARRTAARVTSVSELLPGVGDAISAEDVGRAWREGKPLKAAGLGALTAIGAVPGVGDATAGGIKAMFLGVMAKNADKVALRKAEQMAAKGKHPWDILDDTGWFKGVDGKWRTEIDDSAARLTGKKSGMLPEVLDHPELFQAYPELGKIGVSPSDRMGGSYERAVVDGQPIPGLVFLGNRGDADHQRSVLLHEIQHAVQDIEGFAPGGSFNMPADEYRRLAGEVEARNTQRRLGLTPQQRLEHPFWLSQDTPTERQIINPALR